MDFALYCFLQILLYHFFQFIIHSKGRNFPYRNFRKLENLRVHRGNISSQKLILINIFVLDLCKFIFKKNLDFPVTNFISIKESFFFNQFHGLLNLITLANYQ